jgi:predicted O-linked N-acetylglucosamine transferase (SPINDLY family)
MEVADLLGSCEQLKAQGQPDKVTELYKTWIAFNASHPLLYAVYFNYGVSLSEHRDMAGAINALRAAIRIKPDFLPPYINLGSLLDGQGHADKAVQEWNALVGQLTGVTGDTVNFKAMALKQIGRVLEVTSNDTPAEDALRQCLDINPDQIEVIQHWTSLRARQCKWPLIVEWGQVKKARLIAGISPLSAASYTDDPLYQLSSSYEYNRRSIGKPEHPIYANPVPAKPGAKRLRIGYVSSDLREHAVGFAMTDVIETHNRENVEVFAYYCGVPSSDSTFQRIKQAADHWIDINGMDDAKAAAQIRADGIDILVDLNGYTKDARTKVFALRPAPINVNWFGFPSSMASSYHHYIVADEHIIPESHALYYSEKVLRLPCYQPNDRKRVVATRKMTRAEFGLPAKGFVYCCLNGMQKITAITFDRWMTILNAVPGSVLWLLGGTKDTNERLCQQAELKGVKADRLVFAEKKANPEHVARYALADLFLDTFPYGAHTTAADSMWMGVPILTLPGRSFASRVCMSLVRAAGIPELVCADANDYVARAIAFGKNPTTLAPFKERLTAGRDTCRLFDTPALIADLERLYAQMWDEYQRGALPAPDIANLDPYHEVALDLDLEAIELLSDEAYHALYRERLAQRHATFPIPADNRLWKTPPKPL